VVFLLAAFSLAGLPPLSGFWAKLAIVKSALEAGGGWLAGAALAAGLVTLLSMIKIWNEVFWKPAPDPVKERRFPVSRKALAATVALVAFITWIGLQPAPLLKWSEAAAAGVLADQARIQQPGG
jgi:multicomponent Na+:H+ antiporter subunit D